MSAGGSITSRPPTSTGPGPAQGKTPGARWRCTA